MCYPTLMNIEDYDIVRSSQLFSGLPSELIKQIIGNRAVRHFDKGQIIFQQGDEATDFYVILNGWVKLFRQMPSGEEAVLHIFTTRETFAEAAMFGGHKYPATAEVVANSKLLAINRDHFKNQLKEYPEIAMSMLASATIHLKHMVLELEQIKGRNSKQRVSYFLLGLCKENALSTVITLPYEKSLIASRLGIKPESLSRVLKELRGHGIECIKNQIVVSKVSALRELAMADDPVE